MTLFTRRDSHRGKPRRFGVEHVNSTCLHGYKARRPKDYHTIKSAANGAFGRHERRESAGMRLVTAASRWRSRARRSMALVVSTSPHRHHRNAPHRHRLPVGRRTSRRASQSNRSFWCPLSAFLARFTRMLSMCAPSVRAPGTPFG